MTGSMVGKPWKMVFSSATQRFIGIQSTNFSLVLIYKQEPDVRVYTVQPQEAPESTCPL